MKNFLRKALRVFVVLLFLGLVVGVIGLGIFAYAKDKEVKDLKADARNRENELSEDNTEAFAIKEELEKENEVLEVEIEKQKNEIKDLKSKINSEEGVISGRISPVVLQNLGLSKYQLVCVINSSNKNIQYCETVSTVQGNYSISVPAGTYFVRASAINSETGEVAQGFKAFYTEYVSCVQNNDSATCSNDLSTKNVIVEVKSGQTVEKIDPVDWVSQVGE